MDQTFDTRPGQDPSQDPGQKPSVSFKEWLKLMCIGFWGWIPGAGPIIALVLYIVAAVDERRPKTMNNAVIAGFILCGILIAVSIALILIAVQVINAVDPYFFEDFWREYNGLLEDPGLLI